MLERQQRHLLVVGAVLLMCVLMPHTGCQTLSVGPGDNKTGELYHHNWWNYYERGVSLLKERKIEDARRDFEVSLGIRRGAKFGYDREMWRARTYGLHFLEGYFPNRELGICHYHLGETAEAVKFLQESLRQEPSGRAKHYLNLARERDLARKVVAAPAVGLDVASRQTWTRERRRTVSGTATGEGFVRQVTVNGHRQFVELAEKKMPFRQTLPLRPGTNLVSVTVTDLAGQKAVRDLLWIADWRPPELVIRRIDRQADGWIVEGVCKDDSGLVTVKVDGETRYTRKPRTGSRRVPLQIRFADGELPVFEAEDLAGNQVRTVISPEFQDERVQAGRWPQLAMNSPLDLGALALTEDVPDTTRPTVELGSAQAVVKVFDEEFFLDGRASDAGGLAGIAVNGTEILAREDRGAIRAYFARRIALEPGTNRVEIAVQDMDGNRSLRGIAVIRQEPEYMNERFRLAMVVPPLPADSADLREQVRLGIQGELISQPARFHVLERAEGWNHILRELKLSVSDLSDTRAALRVGKVLSTDMLLLGSLLADGKGLTVYARVLDAQSSDVLFDTDVYSERDADLSYQISGLVMKIEQRFPLISADILRVSGRTATLNVGTDSGLTPDTRFIVVNRSGKSQAMRSGRVCKADGKLVELRIRKLKGDTGAAEIIPASARSSVKEGDYVYAK